MGQRPLAQGGWSWFDCDVFARDYPTMKIATIDAKRRIVLPEALPGEVYVVVREAAGR